MKRPTAKAKLSINAFKFLNSYIGSQLAMQKLIPQVQLTLMGQRIIPLNPVQQAMTEVELGWHKEQIEKTVPLITESEYTSQLIQYVNIPYEKFKENNFFPNT